MKIIKIILIILLYFPSTIWAQNYLTEEQEQRIKLSGRYYWDEGYDFNDVNAFRISLNNLTERIISEVVYQTRKREEVLKELELRAHTGLIKQEGMICVLAWIAKDSVIVTTQKSMNTLQVSPQLTETQKELITLTTQPIANNGSNKEEPSSAAPKTDANKMVDDAVLQELINCKNYKDVRKVAMKHGLVRGDINNAEGFDKPELCYIAVFDSNWTLVALLDKGSISRIDLLSGNKIQNPRNHFRNKGDSLLYLQRK